MAGVIDTDVGCRPLVDHFHVFCVGGNPGYIRLILIGRPEKDDRPGQVVEIDGLQHGARVLPSLHSGDDDFVRGPLQKIQGDHKLGAPRRHLTDGAGDGPEQEIRPVFQVRTPRQLSQADQIQGRHGVPRRNSPVVKLFLAQEKLLAVGRREIVGPDLCIPEVLRQVVV